MSKKAKFSKKPPKGTVLHQSGVGQDTSGGRGAEEPPDNVILDLRAQRPIPTDPDVEMSPEDNPGYEDFSMSDLWEERNLLDAEDAGLDEDAFGEEWYDLVCQTFIACVVIRLTRTRDRGQVKMGWGPSWMIQMTTPPLKSPVELPLFAEPEPMNH
jgi:hypothetical protein